MVLFVHKCTITEVSNKMMPPGLLTSATCPVLPIMRGQRLLSSKSCLTVPYFVLCSYVETQPHPFFCPIEIKMCMSFPVEQLSVPPYCTECHCAKGECYTIRSEPTAFIKGSHPCSARSSKGLQCKEAGGQQTPGHHRTASTASGGT